MTKKAVPLPSKQQVLDFIRESPTSVGKREIARAFNLRGNDKIALKAIMKELEKDGAVERGRKRRVARPGALPDTMVVEVTGTDADGELIAKPLAWREIAGDSDARPPRVYIAPGKAGEEPVGVGDRLLVKLRRLRDDTYEGRAIRRITAGPAKVMGVVDLMPDGSGRLRPTDRRQKADFYIARTDLDGAKSGELVLTEIQPSRPYGLKPVKVVEKLGSMANPKSVSLVAIYTHDIPTEFPEEALAQAKAAVAAPMDTHREDLRRVPLVTIDGEDARDFDDAVWAEQDGDGWHVMVAIADVSWYVRPGDPLDRSAFERGNSVYFPDRVVPMLPEELSNGWCSLRPNEDRPVMAVEMWLDAHGNKKKHRFLRGMMRSAARLTYNQVQAALDGAPDEMTGPLLEPVIKPLYGAWKALFEAREKRGVLDLDLPERKIVLDEEGRVAKVEPRPRYDSHKLIEDMMIAANVCAAETLEQLGQPCMYRVHDLPSLEKLDSLRDFLSTIGMKLSKGQTITPEHFNQILSKVEGTPNAHLVNEVVLRSQAQAVYSPDNLGHFGLALKRYAHFTSPIRRYADLLVHRALIAGMKLGEGALPKDAGERFTEVGEHISTTERRAAQAERDAINRYTALYLADRVGATFDGRINGVTRFGLFVTLTESGADGLVPIGTLPEDYYDHDEKRHCLVGRRTRTEFRLGDNLQVVLSEANPLTGSLIFALEGSEKPAHPGRIRAAKPLRGKRNSRR